MHLSWILAPVMAGYVAADGLYRSCSLPESKCCLQRIVDQAGSKFNESQYQSNNVRPGVDLGPGFNLVQTDNRLQVRLTIERKYWYRDWRPWMNQDWHLARHGTSKWKKYARKYALSSESPRFRWTSTITQKPVMEVFFDEHLIQRLYPDCNIPDDFSCGPPGGATPDSIAYDVELHAGNFCYLGEDFRASVWKLGFLWDNTWLRYRGQFRNVPADCIEMPPVGEPYSADIPADKPSPNEFPYRICYFDL